MRPYPESYLWSAPHFLPRKPDDRACITIHIIKPSCALPDMKQLCQRFIRQKRSNSAFNEFRVGKIAKVSRSAPWSDHRGRGR